MNTEDGAKLYDVCPHVSDSVRWLHPRILGGGGPLISCSSAPGLCRRDFSAESLELTQANHCFYAVAFLEKGRCVSKGIEVWVWAESSRTFLCILLTLYLILFKSPVFLEHMRYCTAIDILEQ